MSIYGKSVKNNIKIMYHTDPDGWCAGYWVAKRFNIKDPNQCIPMNYGSDIDWYSKINNNDKVIIVDFSLELDDMRKLLKKTKDIIWIDHHYSSINKYKDFEVELPGLRYDGIAASVLTYCYFFEMKDGTTPFDPETMPKNAPWFTKYIGDHDVWKFEFGDNTKYFKLGFDCYSDNITPVSTIWEKLEDLSFVNKIIEDGKIIQKYRDSLGIKAINNYSFEYNIDEYKILCLNTCFGGSEWYGDKISEYDGVCSFMYMGKDNAWEYSIYSEKDNINCADLCKKLGENAEGIMSCGGHLKAAGLVHKKYLF